MIILFLKIPVLSDLSLDLNSFSIRFTTRRTRWQNGFSDILEWSSFSRDVILVTILSVNLYWVLTRPGIVLSFIIEKSPFTTSLPLANHPFLPLLLRYNWRTTLWKLKAHSMMVWLSVFWNDFHNSLVNIHHRPKKMQKKKERKKNKNVVFLTIGTLGIYSLNNFQIHHTEVLAIVILDVTFLVLIYNYKYLLTALLQFTLL